MRVTAWLGLAPVLAACVHRAPAPPQALLPGAECYRSHSIIWPLGDTVTYPGITPGSWLILTPERFSAATTHRKVFAYDNIGNASEGGWWQEGDTVRVSAHDLFTNADLKLARTDTDLWGSGSGSTDNGEHANWVARFQRVRCASLPAWKRGS
jgi:hypothetical protein